MLLLLVVVMVVGSWGKRSSPESFKLKILSTTDMMILQGHNNGVSNVCRSRPRWPRTSHATELPSLLLLGTEVPPNSLHRTFPRSETRGISLTESLALGLLLPIC